MKHISTNLKLNMIAALIIISFATSYPQENVKLNGSYLNQTPPGNQPTIFAEGIVSTSANEHGCAFMPDGSEFYFTRIINNRPTIMVAYQDDSGWHDPEIAPFSGRFNDRLPSIAPDGQILFFESLRPWPDSTGPIEYHFWYVKKENSRWSSAKPLQIPVDRTPAGISAAANGKIYVRGITRLDLVNGQYTNPIALAPELKGDYPFIAPDESFIIYCAGAQRNLNVSYRMDDSTWSPPKTITHEQNLGRFQGFPVVSPCGKYLFFTKNHDIYWVSTEISKSP